LWTESDPEESNTIPDSDLSHKTEINVINRELKLCLDFFVLITVQELWQLVIKFSNIFSPRRLLRNGLSLYYKTKNYISFVV